MSLTVAASTKIALVTALIASQAFGVDAAFALEGAQEAVSGAGDPPPRLDYSGETSSQQTRFPNRDDNPIFIERDFSGEFNDNIDLGRWDEVINDGRYTFYQENRWSADIEYEDEFIDLRHLPRMPGVEGPDSGEGARLSLRYRW